MIYRMQLAISQDEILRLYRAKAATVLAVAHTGQRVQFPAQALRAFVTLSGVHGTFELEVSEAGKLIGLRRIEPVTGSSNACFSGS
jgi:hypothetical protein